MRRRDFVTLLGSAAAAWPRAVGAQPSMPVIGLLAPWGRGDSPQLTTALFQGLKDAGFVEGQNVSIEYRLAGNQNERLPTMAADLVRHQVTVIAACATPAALAAKAATTTIPVVFEMGGDPVKLGLVASLNQPGANVTGVTNFNTLVAPKRLELLHELLPKATSFGLLVNPTNSVTIEFEKSLVLTAAHTLGLELHVLNASTEHDFDAVFTQLVQSQMAGLAITADPFFTARADQIAALAVRHAVPTVYENRQFVTAGGLASYGGNQVESYRLAGGYVARILKGERPNTLPVQQTTKIELFLNLKSAKALGLTVPLSILNRADDVIE